MTHKTLSTLLILGALATWPLPQPAAAESAGLHMLEEMQEVITDLAERVKPSVVNILPSPGPGRSKDSPKDRPPPNSPGTGSGVIIDGSGYILTNNHVVGEANEVEVRLSDRTKLIAQVIGKDPDTDLAVLKVSTDHTLPSATFGDSGSVKVGQWALAVGNPFGLERTVTLGVVSGIGRENMNLSRYENFIQTDASINPGNSGGPLFNVHGEVIGINTAIINFAQGIGFAIPSNMAKQVFQQLRAHGKVVRGWLGVGIQPVTVELAAKFGVSENEGVLVNEVFEHDPAATLRRQFADQLVHHPRADPEPPMRAEDGEVEHVQLRAVQFVDHEGDDRVRHLRDHADAVPLPEAAGEVLLRPGKLERFPLDGRDLGHVPPDHPSNVDAQPGWFELRHERRLPAVCDTSSAAGCDLRGGRTVAGPRTAAKATSGPGNRRPRTAPGGAKHP